MKEMKELEGSIALITGAAKGIGAACVEAFQAAGATVRLLDRDLSSASEEFLGLARVSAHRVDISDETAVDAHFALNGSVDILVNCAGIVRNGSITECSTGDFKAALDVNVLGTFLMTRAAVQEALKKPQPLSIINISSIISSLATAPNRLAYATSKAALIGMTKSVALDYIRNDIRCNAVCPGTIDTESLRERIALRSTEMGGEKKAREAFNNRQPIGRMGTAVEIAELVLFIAGKRTEFMTGAVVTADGGFSL
jgi:2-keto-3-deoxy-L-fuconate dehydrogenase